MAVSPQRSPHPALGGIALVPDEVERAAAERHAIVEAALDCIVAMDAHGIVCEFNPAAERTFGYRREEAVGRRLSELIVPPELRERHESALHRHVATGFSSILGKRLELDAVRADGSRLPVELTITRTGDDEPLFVGFLRDLSGTRAAEARRRAAEARHRHLVENLPLATYETTAALPPRIAFVSPQIERLLGYTVEEWLGDPGLVDAVVHPDDRAAVLAERDRSRRDGDRFSLEYRMLHRDGHEVWVQDTSTVLADGEGEPSLTQGFLLDVTERKQLEERLRQSQKMDAIGQLAGGIAHDFNNMLTAISGYSELLGTTFDADDPRATDFASLRAAIGHATALTRQLLAFSRKQTLLPQRLDVNEVVRDVESILRRTIPAPIELRTDLAPDLGAVEADRDQLAQVVLNIALNARDAMPAGGRLTIATRNVDDRVAIELADTGCGMDEATRERIFEPFFTTKATGEGTGLGLATAYGVVSQSGGTLEVESAPDAGSVFRVLLPRAA